MLNYVLKKIVGTKNERELRRVTPLAARVNEFEPKMKALPDDEFPRLTARWKEEVQQKGRPLVELMPEVFAAVREASVRALGMRHFDVQLIGGAVLHQGKIAEMKTGEGKTLVATLPCALNALAGRGVHVVTVNDYLARRDAEWMGRLYRFLGLTTGVIVHGLTDQQRQHEYGCDITYGQNNEFGFDYLRDNMKFRLQDYVQRELHYAIVDEVDSILIDEARTPRPPGPVEESSDPSERSVGRRRVRSRGEPGHPLDDPGPGLHGRREDAHRGDDRRWHRQDGEEAGRREPVRPGSDRDPAPRRAGAASPPPVPQRGGLRGEGRRGGDRRRVHRPHHAGPALVRRPAPGRRGEGEGQDREARTRPSPPSRSRTTSACTRSCPA